MKFLHSVIISLILLLSATTVHSATYYFHNDHLGTPQVLTDENQAVVWKGAYDPFGQVTETVATVEQNLRFPGQYLDRESGLHYNYFRTYDPNTGRYTQSDPIGLGGGVNTYSYTSNNSISSIDPLGLDAWTFNFSINIPFYGGATVGFVEYTGPGVQNRDFGLFATISKHYDGGGLIKAGVGGSYTSGCRQNFDGIGAEISVGLLRGSAKIGVDSGSSMPTSFGGEVGFAIGAEGSITQTWSATIGDVARGIARMIHGDGGSIQNNGSCQCL